MNERIRISDCFRTFDWLERGSMTTPVVETHSRASGPNLNRVSCRPYTRAEAPPSGRKPNAVMLPPMYLENCSGRPVILGKRKQPRRCVNISHPESNDRDVDLPVQRPAPATGGRGPAAFPEGGTTSAGQGNLERDQRT